MCGQHSVRASSGDNTGQNTDKGHTPNPQVYELKFLTPPGIEPVPPGWKAGTLTDHATATDDFEVTIGYFRPPVWYSG